MTENVPDLLSFACPHCGGPLHIEADLVVCEVKHKFRIDEVILEQSRTTARAAWRAVRTLQARAQAARLAIADPDLGGLIDPGRLATDAETDDEMAATLQKYAQMLDLTLSRLDGSPGSTASATP